MEELPGLTQSLAVLRQTFRSGRTRGVDWRKAQLRGILKLVSDNEDKIFAAFQQDLGKHPVESYRDEIGVVKKSANYFLENVEKWMAPKKGSLPLLLFPSKEEVLPEPLGLVLILASWNFPFCGSVSIARIVHDLKSQGQEVSYFDRYEIAHYSQKRRKMVNDHSKNILTEMREEEAAGLKTPAEIYLSKVNGIPRNAKGVAAPKKQVLAFEKLEIQINQEKSRAAEAEKCSTLLTERLMPKKRI